MSPMSKKKFDLDRFVESLELDDDLADFEERRPKKKLPYRRCPRCGSDYWQELFTDKRGKVVSCSECESVGYQ